MLRIVLCLTAVLVLGHVWTEPAVYQPSPTASTVQRQRRHHLEQSVQLR